MQTWIAGGVQSGRLAMGSGANSLYAADYPADALQTEWASGDDAFALLALRQADKAIKWCGGSDAEAVTSGAPVQKPCGNSAPGGPPRPDAKIANPTNRPHHCGCPCRPARVGLRCIGDGWRRQLDDACGICYCEGASGLALVGTGRPGVWNHLALIYGDVAQFPFSLCSFGVGAWWQLLRGHVEWKGPPDLISPHQFD